MTTNPTSPVVAKSDNEILSEFMEITCQPVSRCRSGGSARVVTCYFTDYDKCRKWIEDYRPGEGFEAEDCNENILQFDTSWDWLMPPIKKAIEKFGSEKCDSLIKSLTMIDIELSYKELVSLLKNGISK